MKQLLAPLCCASLAGPAVAHHSFAAFDQQKIVEIEGTLIEVNWVNPHVRLKVRGDDATGMEHTLRLQGVRVDKA
jgi:hypothetical protein